MIHFMLQFTEDEWRKKRNIISSIFSKTLIEHSPNCPVKAFMVIFLNESVARIFNVIQDFPIIYE